jgi:predicted lipid-binding transport protein (Tim44 family)
MKVKRHPLRGLIGGALFGLGVGVLAVVFGQLFIGRVTPFAPLPVFAFLGLVFGLLMPAKGRSKLAPATAGAPAAEPYVAEAPPAYEEPPQGVADEGTYAETTYDETAYDEAPPEDEQY